MMMLDITRYMMVFSSMGTLSGIILMMVLSLIWLILYLIVYPIISRIVYPSAYTPAQKHFINKTLLFSFNGVDVIHNRSDNPRLIHPNGGIQ
ncbi:MAG: hypothetical protein QXS02_05240 [Candidatus Thermoplasmatota archaeon]